MSFKEMDTADGTDPLSEVDSLDEHFDATCLESDTSNEEGAADGMEPEPNAEFMGDYGLVEEVTSFPGDNTINPIDCHRHFITDAMINLKVREINRHAQH